MIGNNPINLLGHQMGKTSHIGFDIGNGDLQFRSCKSSGKSGVRISIHDYKIGLFLHQHRLNLRQDLSRLLSLYARSYPKVVVRFWYLEFLKKCI